MKGKRNEEKLIRKLEIIVSGRVQGVGFRYFTLHKAISLSIRGYVKNTWDGKVKIVAVGDNVEIDIFLQELRQGPPMSVVENIEINELVSTGNHENFRIKY